MLLSVKYHQIEGVCFVFMAFKGLNGVPQTGNVSSHCLTSILQLKQQYEEVTLILYGHLTVLNYFHL